MREVLLNHTSFCFQVQSKQSTTVLRCQVQRRFIVMIRTTLALFILLITSLIHSSDKHNSNSTYTNGTGFLLWLHNHISNIINTNQSTDCISAGGHSGLCMQLTKCNFTYLELVPLLSSPCTFSSTGRGFCCPLHKLTNPSNENLTDDTEQLREAMTFAEEQMSQISALEEFLIMNGTFVPIQETDGGNVLLFQGDPKTGNLSWKSWILIEASHHLSQRSISEWANANVMKRAISGTSAGHLCPTEPVCNSSATYRSVDGSCNNLHHPMWGQSRTVMQRLLPASYSDRIFSPRVSKDGGLLPSARLISMKIVSDQNRPATVETLALMQWGQFIGHDIIQSPVYRMGRNQSGITCCTKDGQKLRPQQQHPACFPISIPKGDPFYSQFGQRCMNFVRSMTGITDECILGPAEKINQATSWLDASMLYGSNDEVADRLRQFSGGRLLMKAKDNREFLQHVQTPKSSCRVTSDKEPCFASGDSRVNVLPTLAALHTVWSREHNRVASGLSNQNPEWDDERLYQESRRIVIAEMQHITYKEWLPLILGNAYVKDLEILPREQGYSNDYDGGMNPKIISSFAAAAYRFGHSLIQGTINLFSETRDTNGTLQLLNEFNKPGVLEHSGNLDSIIRGLVTQSSQKSDNFFAKDVTNHLFEGDKPFGLDLLSMNIQRGRDHGLPPYNDYRELCGLPRASSFENLTTEIPVHIVKKLKRLYRDVEDIDLYIAGVCERPTDGAVIGKTFRYIVGEQFRRLKIGDRFFYELGEHVHSFTEAQLGELKKVTLSRVLCDNSDDLKFIQPAAFQKPSTRNLLDSCKNETIPSLNFVHWKVKKEQQPTKPQE